MGFRVIIWGILTYVNSLYIGNGGGGGLALFGTGCLWTWPTQLAEVQRQLQNQEMVDQDVVMNDSGYRNTVGGGYATTLGSVLHELGHCFDLGHSLEGIMARGFDDIDTALSQELATTVDNRRFGGKQTLKPCSVFSPAMVKRSGTMTMDDNTSSPKFTSVRRSDSVSKYLEEYAEKRHKWSRQQSYNR